MDFYVIRQAPSTNGKVKLYPSFEVKRFKDLMVRGGAFYAIWDEENQIWSTDEYDVARLVDAELDRYAAESPDGPFVIKYLHEYDTRKWKEFKTLVRDIGDNSRQLDQHLTFADTKIKRSDHVSKRLPYSLVEDECPAWDELVGTLYDPEERAKLEWAIGAVLAGEARHIQKFIVLYGAGGTGKSTMINLIEKLFEGYTVAFEAKALTSGSNGFSMSAFSSNPLVAFQHDSDLSRIEDNTKLNSIIAHETMSLNEKYKPVYTVRINAFVFLGTNQNIKISDAKSGTIRRMILVQPTGKKLSPNHYTTLMSRIDFELGAVASHCLGVYREMGKNYYNSYRPTTMMFNTDIFYNFIEYNFGLFKAQDGVSLKQAYLLYKEFCAETGIPRPRPMYQVRTELMDYFEEFKEQVEIDGVRYRSYFSGFTLDKFKSAVKDDKKIISLVLDQDVSLLDELLAGQPAQLANKFGTPSAVWEDVTTKLSDIPTGELHYLRVPENHIVIDFDLTDEKGEKSLERNLEAASLWPPTYAELSRGGAGVHLHYVYLGDLSKISPSFDGGIEIKTLLGDASLRRRFTRGNNIPFATLAEGSLPLKEKKVLGPDEMKSEKSLRDLIVRNLRKEIHPGTKPSIDFIKKILDDAYESGMPYDVTDLRAKIIAFANNSTNQPLQCLKIVQKMQFQSEDVSVGSNGGKDERLVFFDVEVYPNLFVVCWKVRGEDTVVRMINPEPARIEELFRLQLIGFNNRWYDNHMLYACYMGYSLEELYRLSQRLIANDRKALFGEAFGISYADVYDFSSKKQSLKLFEIELELLHLELDLPWDQPVPEELWDKVVEYCVNDVVATEATFEDRKQDFVARQILAELSGLTVNDTTQRHTAKIIFGDDKKPSTEFKYTDLSETFPGYVYDFGKSTYRGEIVGEGGYVYAEPGIYQDVALLDVASMHPTSIESLDLFGKYTRKYSELKQARLAIKHKDYARARSFLGGVLGKFLGNDDDSEALSFALKIVINIVYGLTSAKFDNPFRDIRNKDNIVAKRGALFMIDLKHAVQEQGFTVAHIKTDSIKIPNATPEIIEFVIRFGEKYGYEFEFDPDKDVYEKFCLVNDAVYIARHGGEWTAVGAQFQHPYVYKMLFSQEPLTFSDWCETKQVTKGHIYLDLGEERHFVGRTGRFTPVTKESGGGTLLRVNEDKEYAVTGTKGYFWVESDLAKKLPDTYEIDMTYFERLLDEAKRTIDKFGDYESLIS